MRDYREALTAEGAANGRMLTVGAVLVTCIGATIGKAGLARVQCTTNQQINAIETEAHSISPYWIYWCIVSPSTQLQIKARASATTLPILNKTKFEALPIPLPPLSEQECIVAEVERILSIVDAQEIAVKASLKRTERLRQAILQQAFTGKLVRQDPADEPASVLLERIQAERDAGLKEKRTPTTRPKTRIGNGIQRTGNGTTEAVAFEKDGQGAMAL